MYEDLWLAIALNLILPDPVSAGVNEQRSTGPARKEHAAVHTSVVLWHALS